MGQCAVRAQDAESVLELDDTRAANGWVKDAGEFHVERIEKGGGLKSVADEACNDFEAEGGA